MSRLKDDLLKDIARAINSASAENASNTPDRILAEYLLDCLNAFDRATQQREKWYGRDPRSGPGIARRCQPEGK